MKRKLSFIILFVFIAALLVIPVNAEEQLDNVTDAANLLTVDELIELNDMCKAISDKYDCGVYAVTVDDYKNYGDGTVYQVTYGIYHEYELGRGEAHDGIIFLLSMEDRDFAMFVYGDGANYAFDEYGQIQLEERVIPYFGDDEWYDGFVEYANTCDEFLGLAAEGTPVREEPGMLILMSWAISFLIALIVCSILKAGMKNVYAKREAGSYIAGELNLTHREDNYTFTTTKVISSSSSDDDDDSSSKAESGGGGTGRSGKF